MSEKTTPLPDVLCVGACLTWWQAMEEAWWAPTHLKVILHPAAVEEDSERCHESISILHKPLLDEVKGHRKV